MSLMILVPTPCMRAAPDLWDAHASAPLPPSIGMPAARLVLSILTSGLDVMK